MLSSIHLQASSIVSVRCTIMGGRGGFWPQTVSAHPLSPFCSHVDGYCLVMNTAGNLCHYVPPYIGFVEPASWPNLISAPVHHCMLHQHRPSVWELIKSTQASIHQRLPAGPVPTVLLGIWLQIDRCCMLAASGFYYPGSAGKIQFSQEWLGILTHLSLICEQGSRSERSNTILLVEKFGKMRADGGKIRK